MHYTLEILLTIALIELMWALALYIEHRLHKLIKRKSLHFPTKGNTSQKEILYSVILRNR